jgi:2,4-dienoyl-CoA reductase-like NADH-dependent reductase (Old Yellow Enzyme family)
MKKLQDELDEFQEEFSNSVTSHVVTTFANGVTVTASGGGLSAPKKSEIYSSYQLPFAEAIKKGTKMITGAVGLLTGVDEANTIVKDGRTNLIVMTRELLRNPYFPLQAKKELSQPPKIQLQYLRAF